MIKFAKTSQIVTITVSVLAGSVALRAANTTVIPGGRQLPPTTTGTESPEVTALRPAFNTLLGADHDYQGHRAKAMKAIAEACRELGTNIVPPGTGRSGRASGSPVKHATTEPEAQSTSDDQLRQAQTTVKQVLQGIAAGTQPKVVAHLNEAVSEITVALSVK